MSTVSKLIFVLISTSPLVFAEFAWADFTLPIKHSVKTAVFCADAAPGNVCKMTYQQAVDYCARNHSGLPTVRDFAKWAVDRGATGILSYEDVQERLGGQAPEGYYAVDSVYEDGSVDRFYFNHLGYVAPRRPNVQSSALDNFYGFAKQRLRSRFLR